jgi:hypothetical protein
MARRAAFGAGFHMAAERRGAAGHNGPPRLGLRAAQGMLRQIRRAKLTQNLSQAGAGAK